MTGRGLTQAVEKVDDVRAQLGTLVAQWHRNQLQRRPVYSAA
jgi:hypothetical protein